MSGMGFSKDRLIFDAADIEDSDKIGAYLVGATGLVVTSTTIGGKEAIDVNVVAGPDDAVYAEDSAATDGENLVAVAAVRQDTLSSSVGTDGDHAWLKLNNRGALWTAPVGSVADDAADTENPVKVGSRAASGALGAVSNNDRADLISDLYRRVYINDSPNIGSACGAVTVGATEVALPTSALAGRRRMMVQNVSNNDVYVGPTGVSTANGLRLAKGATLSLEIGQSVNLFAVAGTAGNELRVFELA